MGQFRYIITLLLMSVCSTVCRAADPMYISTSKCEQETGGKANYYFCQNHSFFRLLPKWPGANDDDIFDAVLYASPANTSSTNASTVDMTTPINQFEGKKLSSSNARFNITKEFMEFTTLKQTVFKTFTIVMTNKTTGQTQTASTTIEARYVDLPTGIEDVEYCENKQGQSALFTTYGQNYDWYDLDKEIAIVGFLEFASYSNLSVGAHTLGVRAKSGKCDSDTLPLKITIKKNKPDITLNNPIIVYSSDEDYKNDVQEQSMELYGKLLADEDDGCEIIWYDGEGNKLSAPYKPKKTESNTTETLTLSIAKDCGCGEGEKKSYAVIMVSVPTPKAENLTLCATEEDKTVTVKHPVSITATGNATKADYALEVSTDSDFLTSTTGEYGEENVDITINTKGEKSVKYYVRQVNNNGVLGKATEFYIKTKKVEEPLLSVSSDKICVNDTKEVDLNDYITSSDDVEWNDGTNTIDKGIYDVSGSGNKTFTARAYAGAGNEKCYSSSIDFTLDIEELDATLTAPTEICEESDLNLSVSISGGNSPTYKWSCMEGGKIDSGKDRGNTVVVHPSGNKDYTIECDIEAGTCNTTETLNVKKIKGETEGTVKIVRSDGTTTTYTAGEEITMESCDLDSKAIVSLTHTSAEISYLSPTDPMPNSLTYSGNEAEFNLTQWGDYWVRFTNTCAQEITFNLKGKNAPTESLTNSSDRLCKGDKKEIDLTAYSQTMEWRDASDNTLADSKGKLSDETALNYKFYAYPYTTIKGDGNSETRCYGTPETLNIDLDTLSVEIVGATTLCLDETADLEAKIKSTDNSSISYQWVLSPSGELNNTDKIQIIGTGEEIKAELTVSTSKCKRSATHTISATQGIANGTVSIKKNSDNSEETYTVGTKIAMESCDLGLNITFTLDHTSTDIAITTPTGKTETITFIGDKAEYTPTEWGTYKANYTNGCSVDFEFSLMKPTLSSITLTKDEDYLCSNATTSVDLNSYIEGSTDIEWKDETDNTLSNHTAKFSDETKRIYTFTAYPYTIITSKNGNESRCYGDKKTLTLYYDNLSAEIDGVHSICPDEKADLSAIVKTTSNNINYKWTVSPSSVLTSSSLTENKITIKGDGSAINVSLAIEANACKTSLNHDITVGKGVAKGSISMVKDGREIKKVKAGEETLEFVYCGEQQLKLDLEHSDDSYTITNTDGQSSTQKFSDGNLSLNETGEYSILFTNQCETELRFIAKNAMKPQLKLPTTPLCLNTETTIIAENTEGCTITLEGESKTFTNGKISFTPEQTGTIEKTYAVNCDGCEITPSDKLKVEINSDSGLGKELIISASNTKICNGETIEITELRTEPESNFTIRWKDNSDIKGDKTSPTITIRPNIKNWKNNETYREITYTATLTSTSNCATTSNKEKDITLKATVGRPIEFTIEGKDLVCDNNGVTLSIKGVSTDAKYSWSSEDDNKVENHTKPTITVYPEIGTSKYQATVSRHGCTASQTFSLKAGATPILTDVEQTEAGEVTVIAQSPSDKGLSYSIGEKKFEDGDLGRLIPGKYTLRITDTDGCRLDTVIKVNEPSQTVNLFFTPNGDGVNDAISIPGEFLQYETTKMYIYDRKGKKIAVLDSNNSEWDGTYNGHQMPSEDYWYELIVDAIRKYYIGHFTLIR